LHARQVISGNQRTFTHERAQRADRARLRDGRLVDLVVACEVGERTRGIGLHLGIARVEHGDERRDATRLGDRRLDLGIPKRHLLDGLRRQPAQLHGGELLALEAGPLTGAHAVRCNQMQ